MWTQVKNQPQALESQSGGRRKSKLWSVAGRAQLQSLALLPRASRRREHLLKLLDELETGILELCDRASR